MNPFYLELAKWGDGAIHLTYADRLDLAVYPFRNPDSLVSLTDQRLTWHYQGTDIALALVMMLDLLIKDREQK